MNEVPNWLQENGLELISTLGTFALLGVTAWYAKTTKDMATIARDAASESARATAAAENAADAARDAATVAQARIKPDFAGRLISVASGTNPGTPCIQIKSYGDSVVIQRVISRRSFRHQDKNGAPAPAELVGEDFAPHGDENLLPRRLHPGEVITLTHPTLGDGAGTFERFIVDIAYTFSEQGGTGGTKQLVFNAINSKW